MCLIVFIEVFKNWQFLLEKLFFFLNRARWPSFYLFWALWLYWDLWISVLYSHVIGKFIVCSCASLVNPRSMLLYLKFKIACLLLDLRRLNILCRHSQIFSIWLFLWLFGFFRCRCTFIERLWITYSWGE